MSRKYNKTFTNLKTVVHDTSILDAQKILVNVDKTNPSERTNLISYIDNSVDSLKNPQDAGLRDIVLGEVIEKTFNVNTFGADLDNATITGFQYSFAHFIADGKLLSLTFPYSYNGSSVNEGYLFVEVCDADFNRLTKAYSENTFGFGNDGSSAVFTFENLILPKEYHIIRFALVADTEKEPDFSNGNNCLSFRSRPLKIGSNVRFDDDECLIYNGSSTENWVIDASVVYEARDGGLVQEHKDDIEKLDTDIFNLNTELNRVDSSIGTLYNELNPQIQALKTKNYAYTDAENTFKENITIEKTVYATELNSPTIHTASVSANNVEIGRESLNSSELAEIKELVLGQKQQTVSNMEGTGAIGQVVAARIANPYFASGTISNVRIFHNTGHTVLFDTTPRYLYLNVDGTVYRSEAVIYDKPVQYSDFKFNNITIPSNYLLVDILMSTNPSLENPSYTNRTGSINFSSAITHAANTYGNSRVRINQGGEAEIANSAIIKLEITTGSIEGNNVLESIDKAVKGILTEGLTFNTNIVNGTLDNASIKGIQYSKDHFVTDAHITSIAIPYNYQSGASNTGYLYIEIINEEGIVVNSAYSVESGSFNDSSSGEHNVTFNFSAFYVPENYKLVRLALVTNKTTVPNIVTTENCLSFRARPIKLNNNVNYDDDDCMIYASATNTQNWVVALTVIYNQIIGGVTDDILYNNIRAERLLKDVNSLAAASKTHISNEEAQNKFANKAGTETAINKIGYTFEVASDASGDGECDAIHYAATKIPHNIEIDEVRIPVLNDSPKALYLAVWIINQSDAKTYIGISDEAVTWAEGEVAVWKFTNNPISVPENYKLELFLAESAPQSGANSIPASSNYIKTYINYSGSGTLRYSGNWHSGRDVRTTFVKNGIVVNHEDRISILEKKTPDIEYHLNDEIAHLSFIEKVSLASLYTISNGNYNSYWSSNEIDEAETFIDAQCSTFILHEPSIFIKNSLLGVIQIPYSLASDAQCNLKIVCRDSKSNTDLVESLSTNTVDYSLATGYANYFFEPFILPYNADEVIFNFVDINGNSVTAPVTLVDSEISNGDQYNDGSSKSGRVFLLQFRPSTHPTQFVRDLDSPRWPLYELLEDGTYSMDFYSFKGFSSIGFNPHPENGNSIVVDDMGFGLNNGFIATVSSTPAFFSCICTFTEASDDAYIKVNGHPLYTGSVFASEDGSFFNTFPVELLLGPNDTIEISPYVKLRAIRFTDGKYV